MGGIWTPPLKLLDGIWFGIDDQWVGPAHAVHERLRLRPLHPARHGGDPGRAHRLRPRRPPRRPVPPQADQPGRRAHRHVQGRRALRADARATRGASTASRRTRASSSPTPARSTATRSCSATRARSRTRTRRRTTTRRSSAPTATPSGGETGAGHFGAAARHGLQPPEPGEPADDAADAARVRRRPVRQGHRRPAALLGRRCPASGSQDRLGRGRRLRQGPRAARARSCTKALDDPAGALAAKVAAREKLGALHEALAARRPAAGRRASTGASRTWPTSRRSPRTCRSATSTRASTYPQPQGTLDAGALGRRRLPRLPVDVRHRRRVHGVRERRDRPVRGDRGPHARAARHLRHRQRALAAR